MSNLATLIQTKSVRKNEIRDEIGNLMSCLFTASLLVYAVRHQDIQNIDCIEVLAKHLTLNVHESEIEALKEKSGFLRTVVSRSKDFDEFDHSQKGCFEKAFDSSDDDGWMVTDVSDELYDIVRCLASDLSVSHSRKLTVEGLIVDLLQSDVSKAPWASIDHPGVFTKAQVDEEIMLRLVSNRYGGGPRGTVGVLIDRFDGDAFPTELFTEEQKRLIEKIQIGNYSRGSETGTCSPPDLIIQNGFASRQRIFSGASAEGVRKLLAEIQLPNAGFENRSKMLEGHPVTIGPLSEMPPRLLDVQVESEPSNVLDNSRERRRDWMQKVTDGLKEHGGVRGSLQQPNDLEAVGRGFKCDVAEMVLKHENDWLDYCVKNMPVIVPTTLSAGDNTETLAKSTVNPHGQSIAQDDKSAFKQKVRDLCESHELRPTPNLLGKNKPMNETVNVSLPTTLKDFINEKDD